jgi:phosphoribosylanthranilate isomerase
MLRVKICGNRTAEDVAAAVAMGADAIGLIVGVRHRSEDAIAPEQAAQLLRGIPVFVTSVLVTHLISPEQIVQLHKLVPTSTIQLHDAIPVEGVAALRAALPGVCADQGRGRDGRGGNRYRTQLRNARGCAAARHACQRPHRWHWSRP